MALIVDKPDLFPDNWIYIHEPSVKVGRIQNFRSWSPEMVPDAKLACLGLEYFCFEGDGLWTSSDAELVALAKKELAIVGLAAEADVKDGCVVRQKKAYPVYDESYKANVEAIRTELAEKFPTLHLVGRNGMHKYNNQDHAMMTAMLTVKNILAGETVYDVWNVNEDAEYHEAGEPGAAGARQRAPGAAPARHGSELTVASLADRSDSVTQGPDVSTPHCRRAGPIVALCYPAAAVALFAGERVGAGARFHCLLRSRHRR